MKAIRVHQYGGPEALVYEEISMPEPGPDEVRVHLQASGVNYIDTYHRGGLYKTTLPITPGMEGGGIVDAIGDNVSNVSPGDRVAYAMYIGTYAEYAIVPAWRLVKLPDWLAVDTAAAVLLKGMTAQYLVRDTYPIKENDTVLIHAAAGGMGLLLVQMAKICGARVIGTTSTAEKAQLALEYGADEIILYTQDDFVEATKELTGGKGVNAVFDGVGQQTFLKGLDCLRPRGYMVLFGQASGPVAPLDPQVLNQKGSLFLTRPSLGYYTLTHDEIQERADEMFNWIGSGALKVRIDRGFPLKDAADAHRYLEARKTKGNLILHIQVHHPETPSETINIKDPIDEIGWESFPASDPPAY